MAELKPAYLIHGDDHGAIALEHLHARGAGAGAGALRERT